MNIRIPLDSSVAVIRAAIIAIVVLCGAILSHAARWFADGLAVNAQLYFHAFRFDNVHSPWVLAPLRFFSAAALQHSALASWGFACGYLCTRAATRRAGASIGAFVAVTLAATAFTTTSVRLAQPHFFDNVVTTTVFPMAVKLLFVAAPACLAALAVRHRAASPLVVSCIAFVAIVLTGWNYSDVGNALTFGCVRIGSAGTGYCTSREGSWGLVGACVLALVAACMAWDAVRSGLAERSAKTDRQAGSPL